MRTSICILMALPLMVACQGKVKPTVEPTKLVATVKPIDFSKAPSMAEQYRTGNFSVGFWVNQKPGQIFQAVKPQNPNGKQLVYLLPPPIAVGIVQTAVAPNFFLNGERIPSLINNHYYWMELPERRVSLNPKPSIRCIAFSKTQSCGL